MVQGPTPVWGGADGRTPEGVFNLAGNVAEWIFDWEGPMEGGLHHDWAGPACDDGAPGHERVVRGSS